MAERLDCVSRTFAKPLIIGPLALAADKLLSGKHGKPQLAPTSDAEARLLAVEALNEEHMPFERGQFDLVIAAGTLDSVNDLPGALSQIARALKPDGLFLASLFGAGTLASLKMAMLKADNERPCAHIHPQIELKVASDLLTRAGFALPVADRDSLTVRYSDWRLLRRDLRDHGCGNAMAGRRPYLGANYFGRLDEAWNMLADEQGKVVERFEFIHLSGWAPAPSQPSPAKRGSGRISLASILPTPKA